MKIISAIALLSLTACASITAGNDQSLSITTSPEAGATCELSNDAGKWFVSSTPGSVVVIRDAADLTVICKKGNLSGTARVVSFTKSLAFGNILAGGIIGVAVDRGTGAAFDYPALINVPISKEGSSIVIEPPPVPKQPESTRRHQRR